MNEESLRTNDYINEVLSKYSDMVYRLALSQTKNKADAEDIFQEVFMRYMARSGSFAGEEHRKAWLIRVTLNCSRKLFRSAWFRRTVPLEGDMPAFDSPDKSDVYFAVMALPRKYRTAVHLFYYEDLPISKIGELLSLNESTVKSHLRRARKLLKSKMKGEVDPE